MADDEYDLDIGDGDFCIEDEDEEYGQLVEAAPVPATAHPDNDSHYRIPATPTHQLGRTEEAQSSVQFGGNDDDMDLKTPASTDNRDNEKDVGRNGASNFTSTAPTSESENVTNPIEGDEMDDEYDYLMSQIELDENLINQACEKGNPVTNNEQAAVSSKLPSVISANSNLMKNHQSNSNSVFKTPSIPTPAKGPARSPLKREMSSEISDFFLSQEDSYNIAPVKRRFPGPAGLLSKTGDSSKLSASRTNILNASKPIGLAAPRRIQSPSRVNVNILKRKESETLVSNAPWRSLIKTLSLNLKDDNSLINAMNIDWVKQKAKKFPPSVKIPLLVLVVKEELGAISSKSKKRICVRLMDHSGMITAALDASFIEAYGDKIVPGTSLALRNCRILLHRKSVILTVSKKNVLCLTTTKQFTEPEAPPSQNQFPSYKAVESGIYLLQRAAWAPERILLEYQEVIESMKKANDQQEEPENVGGTSRWNQNHSGNGLFTTVSVNNTNVRDVPEPQRPTTTTTATNVNNAFFSSESAHANFTDDASGFDDDDDEFLQALEGMDFEIEEDNL